VSKYIELVNSSNVISWITECKPKINMAIRVHQEPLTF